MRAPSPAAPAQLRLGRAFPASLDRAQRLLDYIQPDFVHIMEAGRIKTTGGMELVDQLEAGGYATLSA